MIITLKVKVQKIVLYFGLVFQPISACHLKWKKTNSYSNLLFLSRGYTWRVIIEWIYCIFTSFFAHCRSLNNICRPKWTVKWDVNTTLKHGLTPKCSIPSLKIPFINCNLVAEPFLAQAIDPYPWIDTHEHFEFWHSICYQHVLCAQCHLDRGLINRRP